MSRFRPDGWAELLGRTFALADFQGGLYVEVIAPDLRPGALAVLFIVGVFASLCRRSRAGARQVNPVVGINRVLISAALAWLASWACWLAVSGNGRYALPLLVLVGPLLGAMLWRMPLRADWRWLLLCLVIAGQGMLLNSASPSQSWSMLRHRWTEPDPFSNREALLGPLKPDVIIVTQSQTMTALLVNTPAAADARWVSLSLADGMGRASLERSAAAAIIERASQPILLESYNTDLIDANDISKLMWRRDSVQILARFGLEINGDKCQKALSPMNVMQVGCGLRPRAQLVEIEATAHNLAEERMARLITLCRDSLWPLGAREVLDDGSLVQVFRESRYIVRTDRHGVVYIKRRGDINFNKKLESNVSVDDGVKSGCLKFLN